ncbi:hypothetical protein TNCT_410661 [Trichonephila clavata]|uniref:Uncharacterized protein n=1 Tax=Trichonephila clavata TaxID=2740835 RepID=A0A8X6H258_TRICU|nr:hypothetical protein TNCT_410661 [Trichonephila clavata]
MSVQRFMKLEETLEFLSSLNSDESDFEIVVLLPDISELTDEDEGDEDEVNTGCDEKPRISNVHSGTKGDICTDSAGQFLLKQEKQRRCLRRLQRKAKNILWQM